MDNETKKRNESTFNAMMRGLNSNVVTHNHSYNINKQGVEPIRNNNKTMIGTIGDGLLEGFKGGIKQILISTVKTAVVGIGVKITMDVITGKSNLLVSDTWIPKCKAAINSCLTGEKIYDSENATIITVEDYDISDETTMDGDTTFDKKDSIEYVYVGDRNIYRDFIINKHKSNDPKSNLLVFVYEEELNSLEKQTVYEIYVSHKNKVTITNIFKLLSRDYNEIIVNDASKSAFMGKVYNPKFDNFNTKVTVHELQKQTDMSSPMYNMFGSASYNVFKSYIIESDKIYSTKIIKTILNKKEFL